MNSRKLTFLAVIVVLIGLYYYFVEVRFQEIRRERDARRERLFPYDPKAVTSLRIERAEGVLEFERSGEGWRIWAPLRVEADGGALDALVQELVELKPSRTVEEKPADLAPYGLESPAYTVVLRVAEAEGKEKAAGLLVGDENPRRTELYALKEGETAVVLLPISLKAHLARGLIEFRDRRVLRVSPEEVVAIEVSRAGRTLRFEMDDERVWWIADAGGKLEADEERVQALLRSLELDRVEAFIDQPVEDLAVYGLSAPAAVVSLFLKEQEAPAALSLGHPVPSDAAKGQEDGDGVEVGGRVYARVEGDPKVLELPDSLLEKLPEDRNDFRQRSLFRFNTFDVERVELRNAHGSFILVKEGPSLWTIESPKKFKAESYQVSDLLYGITAAEAREFLDPQTDPAPLGLKTPATSAKLWLAGREEPLELRLGRAAERAEGYYASVAHSPDLYVVGTNTFEDLDKDLLTLRDKALSDFSPTDVERFEIALPEALYLLIRKGGHWLEESLGKLKGIEPAEIDALVGELGNLEFSTVVAEGDAAKDAAPLPSPAAKLRFWRKGEEKAFEEVLFGENQGDEAVEATSASHPGLYLVNQAILDRVRDLARRLEHDPQDAS